MFLSLMKMIWNNKDILIFDKCDRIITKLFISLIKLIKNKDNGDTNDKNDKKNDFCC